MHDRIVWYLDVNAHEVDGRYDVAGAAAAWQLLGNVAAERLRVDVPGDWVQDAQFADERLDRGELTGRIGDQMRIGLQRWIVTGIDVVDPWAAVAK
ncbi:hypothetical protein LO763_19610 [Glycomyces sp. A-F 0318]|uniref:hypothetical protein n=1 Tax=Glycomyces amatae TaxID=2881355 RepID=UPI001E4EC895|nr:hypothetical protein [Glycomyces amatae]MCD0445819.1 hypothetical protein [Glycomyces amatae]